MFGRVARSRVRVTLPTQHRVLALAAGAVLLVVLAWWVPVPRGPVASVSAALGCVALGLLLGILFRRAPAEATRTGSTSSPDSAANPHIDEAPDGVLIVSDALRVVSVNGAFLRMSERASIEADTKLSEVLGRPEARRIDGDFLIRVGKTPFLADVIAASGERIPVEVTFARLLDGTYEFFVRDGAALQRAETELSHSRAQLHHLTRRLSAGIEEERRRIAREVHDELGQQLIRLKHDVSWLRARTPTAETAERIAALGEVLDETAAIVRRIASELRPSVLDELGLSAAVEWLVLDFGRRTGLATSLSLDDEADRLESGAATALFRILQEALTNIAKHANARRVHVRLLRVNDEVSLEVRDDGRGLRPADVVDPSRMGLLGMKERAEAFGGAIQVTALPEVGTTVLVRVPVAGVGTVRIA